MSRCSVRGIAGMSATAVFQKLPMLAPQHAGRSYFFESIRRHRCDDVFHVAADARLKGRVETVGVYGNSKKVPIRRLILVDIEREGVVGIIGSEAPHAQHVGLLRGVAEDVEDA